MPQILTLENYTSSAIGRRRINIQTGDQRPSLGISIAAAFAFGLVFVAVGLSIVLVGTKVIAVNPASVQAPYWVLTAAGASFACGGLMVWAMACHQFLENRARLQIALKYPDDVALNDYDWHPEGCAPSRWSAVAKVFCMAMFLTVFLSMFNWWAFFVDGPWMVKGIVSLFDLVAVGTWVQVPIALWRALKFRGNRVVFTTFPYRLPDPIILRWVSPSGINLVKKGTFTLRCIEGSLQTMGAGQSQMSFPEVDELWSGTRSVDVPLKLERGDQVELRFDPPPGLPPSCLTEGAPTSVQWELEAKLDLHGLDFAEKYLIPVYAAK